MKAKIKNEQGEVLKAGGVICNDIGEILLVQIPGQPFWSFPKGHVEGIESDEEAALRELREETGYIVHIITQLPDVCYENEPPRAHATGYPETARWAVSVKQLRCLQIPYQEFVSLHPQANAVGYYARINRHTNQYASRCINVTHS